MEPWLDHLHSPRPRHRPPGALSAFVFSRMLRVGLRAHLEFLCLRGSELQCCSSQRASLGGSGWTDISGLDARWARGALTPGVAVGLENLAQVGGKDRGSPSTEAPRDLGVVGGAFDLDQVLPPGDAPFLPPTPQLSLVGFLLLVEKLRF